MSHPLAFTLGQEENAKALKICTWWSNIFCEHNYIIASAYTFLKDTISAQLKPILIHMLMIDSHWIHHGTRDLTHPQKGYVTFHNMFSI